MTVIRWLNAIAQLPPPSHIALGKSWGKLADGWTVGLAEIS